MKLSTLLTSLSATILMAGAAQAQIAVKLGVLNDMSGVYADISGPGSVVAAQMAVEDSKAADHGIKIEIVSADHQNKPDVGSAIARKWYDQDGVDAILDVTTSSVALAVSEVTREKNKIFMISGGGTSDLTGPKCTPNNVHWTYDTWALANGTGTAMTKRGGNTWFFLTADYAFGAALERDTAAAVQKNGGKVVGQIKHALSASDFSSQLLQAQGSQAKVIALANGTGTAMTKRGGNTWFFLTADYAFGAALERDTAAAVQKNGGKVVGQIKHALSASDFSSQLLQAQGSQAKVIALANAGADTTNAIKQASEFGITQGGQALAGLLVFSSDVKALGLKAAQGLVLTDAFYWDQNDATRGFAKRFAAKFGGKMPTSSQAGVYSSILHYVKALEATKSKDTAALMAKMREIPVEDELFGKGQLRIDGRVTHPMYLFEVKKPEESKGEWDMYKTLATIPADQAFRPLNEGGCPLVKS